jgi:hypothetical protein
MEFAGQEMVKKSGAEKCREVLRYSNYVAYGTTVIDLSTVACSTVSPPHQTHVAGTKNETRFPNWSMAIG